MVEFAFSSYHGMYQVSKVRFSQLVEEALDEVPAEFARHLEEVPVEIRDRASAKERKKLGLGARHLLLGLYCGRPMTERSVEESGRMPDVIYIFQEDIQAVCSSEEDLKKQVRKTVLHEIGHHFGLDEGDLSDLGYG